MEKSRAIYCSNEYTEYYRDILLYRRLFIVLFKDWVTYSIFKKKADLNEKKKKSIDLKNKTCSRLEQKKKHNNNKKVMIHMLV